MKNAAREVFKGVTIETHTPEGEDTHIHDPLFGTSDIIEAIATLTKTVYGTGSFTKRGQRNLRQAAWMLNKLADTIAADVGNEVLVWEDEA